MELKHLNSRTASRWLGVLTLSGLATLPALGLPPADRDPATLLESGQPVSSIPIADSVSEFEPLDGEHVMLSTRDHHYLLTLNRECFGLRWARHVGVTASDNTIWAGFDALTADGEACPIRAIHRLEPPPEEL